MLSIAHANPHSFGPREPADRRGRSTIAARQLRRFCPDHRRAVRGDRGLRRLPGAPVGCHHDLSRRQQCARDPVFAGVVARALRAPLVRRPGFCVRGATGRNAARVAQAGLSDVGDSSERARHRTCVVPISGRRHRPRDRMDRTELRVLQRNESVPVPGGSRLRLAGAGDRADRADLACHDGDDARWRPERVSRGELS